MARKITRFAAIILTLFCVGMAVGKRLLTRPLTYRVDDCSDAQASDFPAERETPKQDSADHSADSGVQEAAVTSVAKALVLGDGMLLAGNPAGALRHYRALMVRAGGEPADELRYRLAVCAEALRNPDRALAEYRQLASQSPDSPIGVAARLGQARVWNQLHRPLLAKQVLWRALLDLADEDAGATKIRAEFTARLAQILAHQAREGSEKTLWAEAGIVDPAVPWSTEQSLLWLSGLLATAPASSQVIQDPASPPSVAPASVPVPHPEQLSVEISQRLGSRPEEIHVHARLPQMPVASAVELILQKAGLKFHWSPGAREAVAEHTVQVRVGDMNLALLLDHVLDPLDLLWEVDSQGLQIHSPEEVAQEVRVAFRRSIAERMLRRVLTMYPDHELADEAYWVVGNLAFDRGQLEAAALQYQQYLRQFPQSRTKAGVHFSLAKVQLLTGQREPAMEQFYHVVDEAVGDDITTAAYLYLGRLYLEDDRASRALKPLSRGLALAQDQADKAVTALTLASAYLMCGNPSSANQVLMDQRGVLAANPYCDQAAFLAALARFEAAAGPGQIETEGRALITALSHARPEDFFGAQGFVLVARAYRKLELLDEVHQILIQGLCQPHLGALRQRMLYDTAQYLRRMGDRDQARETLRTLAQQGAGEWGRRAKLDLADLEFRSGNDAACLGICRQLIETAETEDARRDLLRIVGQVFERQGNYRSAAQCFAGIPPQAETTSRPQAPEN